MNDMPPRSATRRRLGAILRTGLVGVFGVMLLAGCSAGLSSGSKEVSSATSAAPTTAGEPTTTASSSGDSDTPARSDDDTEAGSNADQQGAEDQAALGIGDEYFPDSGNPGYDVTSYDLAFDMDDDLVTFEAVATIALRTTDELDELRFDLDGLTVAKATIDGDEVKHRRAGLDLVLTPDAPLPADEPVAVIVEYGGTPEPRGSDVLGELGWIGEPGEGSYVVSEPDGASNWFPANDHPSDKATFSFEITTPEGVEAVANGTRTGEDTAGGRTTWTWSPRDPMATYLATVAVGQYTFFENKGPGGIPLLSAVADGVVETSGKSTVEAALGQLPGMMTLFAGRFGPYPFETYGVIIVDEPLGFALETQTRSLFGSDSWNEPVFQAHELAHQWYGDSVGIEAWEDIWLNEGFATMGEWLWAESDGGTGGPPLSAGSSLDPPLDPGPDGLFDTSVYQRGGLTLKALRGEVGDEAFFQIMKTWATDNALGNATTEDLLDLIEQDGGAEARDLVEAWLTDPEPPK